MKVSREAFWRGVLITFAGALILYWISCTQTPIARPSASATEVTEPPAQNAPNFPPLRFSSSGHLPTKIQGFQLGMSLSDVLSIDPTLENFDGTKASNGKLNATLVSKRNGFSTELRFSDGRLLYIQSGAGSISAADGQQFDTNTVAQLGQPDFDVYKGPESKRLVWADGDIRIAYANRSCGTFSVRGGRCAELEVAIYPIWLSSSQNSPEDKLMSKDAEINSLRYNWERGAQAPVLKTLPVHLSGLRLGMTASEVRAVVHGIDISSHSENESVGTASSGNVRYDVYFWSNRVCSFCRTTDNFPAAEFDAVRKNQYALLGTPSSELLWKQFQHFEWDDGKTVITGDLTTGSNAQGSSIEQCMRDKQTYALRESAREDRAAQYKPSPETKSFF